MHTKSRLLLFAVVLATLFGVFFSTPVSANSEDIKGKVDHFLRQWEVNHVSECLSSTDQQQRLQEAVREKSGLKARDFAFGSGNSVCRDSLNTRIDRFLGGSNLSGERITQFFVGIGYRHHVDSSTGHGWYTRTEGKDAERAVQRAFLSRYNNGNQPDFTSKDAVRGMTVGLWQQACTVERVGLVSSIQPGSPDHPKLNHARNGTPHLGTTYAIVRDINNSGQLESVLYSLKGKGSSSLSQPWYYAMSALGVSSRVTPTSGIPGPVASVSTITDQDCAELATLYSNGNAAIVAEATAGTEKNRMEAAARVWQNIACPGALSGQNATGIPQSVRQGYRECLAAVLKAYEECSARRPIHPGSPTMITPSQQQIEDCLKGKLPDKWELLDGGAERAEQAANEAEEVQAESTEGSLGEIEGGEAAKPTCLIEGIGWLLCPTLEFLAKMADVAFNFLADAFLVINPEVFSDSNSGTRTAWATFQAIANVILVIAFILLIFSQMTGAGMSNYGIKKMLPKVITTAILINISFLLVQAAIDISNILGYSVKNILGDIVPPPQIEGRASGWSSGEGLYGLTGTILAGGAAGAAGVVLSGGWMLALAALVVTLFSALVSLFIIFIILTVRQVLVVLLVVLAPLAFAFMLLPGTEKAFQMWKKAFIALLLLFPIIGLLFGGSTLASNVLMSAMMGSEEHSGVLASLVASAAQVLPLFLVWPLLKKSLDGVLGGGIMNAFHKGAAGLRAKGAEGFKKSSVGQGINNALDFRKQRRTLKQAQRRSNAKGPMGALYNLAGGGNYAQTRAREAVVMEDKEEEEAVSNEMLRMKNELGPSGLIANSKDASGKDMFNADGELVGELTAKNGGAAYQLQEALKNNDTASARAATKLLLSQRGKGRKQLKAVLDRHQQDNMVDANGNITAEALSNSTYKGVQSELAGLKGSDNVLDQMGYSGQSVRQAKGSAGTYDSLDDVELSGQDPTDIKEAVKNNHISADRARSMLNNSNLKLTEEKRRYLQEAVDRGNTGPVRPTGAPASGSSGGSNSGGGDGQQPSAPATAQEAKDLINGAGNSSTPSTPPSAADAKQMIDNANPLEGGGAIPHGDSAPGGTNDATQQANINVGQSGERSRTSDRTAFPNQATENLSNRFNNRNNP